MLFVYVGDICSVLHRSSEIVGDIKSYYNANEASIKELVIYVI